MKNKKSIAMAMAAVSTLGAVAPAFADNVESRILVGNESVDVRLASGYTLKTVEGKTVVAREKIYNYNGAPNDRSKHTLKNEFKDCKILIEKLGTTPNKDVFVLGEKVTDTVSVSQETAKLNALNSEIATYVANGYTKEEREDKGSIIGDTYVSGNKVVTLKKGNDTKIVTFTNIDVLKDDASLTEVEQANALRKEVFGEDQLTAETNVNLEGKDYSRINELKYKIESNIAKFDIVKDETGAANKDLKVTLYKKGAKKVPANIVKEIVFENVAKVDNKLLVNIPQSNDFNNHWAKTQIVNAMLNGQVDASGSFRPQEGITRAEFAKIACTVFGIATNDKNTEPFNDVSKADWFYKYVAALYQEKATTADGKENQSVIQGDGENFRPNDKITRQEVAVIVAKLQSKKIKETMVQVGTDAKGNPIMGHVDVATKFKDDASIATWADESVSYLNTVKYATVEGKDKFVVEGDNGYFNPTQSITRAEALVMVQRAASVAIK